MSRRCSFAVLLLALIAVPALAQAEGSIYPALKVGTTGHFKKDKDNYHKGRVVKVIAINAVIARVGQKEFVLSEIRTKDLADDDDLDLKGEYKVTGTFKYRDTTYKLVVKQKEKK